MEKMSVKQISECFVKPRYNVMESEKPHYLAPLDLIKLSSRYIQKGLLFVKPTQSFSIHDFLEDLKESLSLTLVHFYPLAGQLATRVDEANHECLIYVDCNKGPGVKFIHATLDATLSDILPPTDVPLMLDSLFDHHKAFNYDGHTRGLLSVQVTDLRDGLFIGCSANHAVVDGTSYWEFWNMWSEIHMSKGKGVCKSRLPVYERWFPDGFGEANPVLLPLTHPDKFIACVEPPQLRIRFFHFTSKSIQRLKAEANEETDNSNIISSFQALSALVWRSVIRSNRVCHTQITNFRLTANNRHRLDPPLPKQFFGNCVSLLKISTTAGELVENSLGWAASLLKKSIVNHNDKEITDSLKTWLREPSIPKHGIVYDSSSVLISSSPRFDMYGNEFGVGKAVAVRSGYANKFEGKVIAYPGCEGGGSVELEICLTPDSMTALESDIEFMSAVTLA